MLVFYLNNWKVNSNQREGLYHPQRLIDRTPIGEVIVHIYKGIFDTIFIDKHKVKQSMNGKSAQFPLIG